MAYHIMNLLDLCRDYDAGNRWLSEKLGMEGKPVHMAHLCVKECRRAILILPKEAADAARSLYTQEIDSLIL
jgi:hypothetical protein